MQHQEKANVTGRNAATSSMAHGVLDISCVSRKSWNKSSRTRMEMAKWSNSSASESSLDALSNLPEWRKRRWTQICRSSAKGSVPLTLICSNASRRCSNDCKFSSSKPREKKLRSHWPTILKSFSSMPSLRIAEKVKGQKAWKCLMTESTCWRQIFGHSNCFKWNFWTRKTSSA